MIVAILLCSNVRVFQSIVQSSSHVQNDYTKRLVRPSTIEKEIQSSKQGKELSKLMKKRYDVIGQTK